MVDKKSQENISENLDITDELIAERRTSTKMPKDMDPWMAKTIEFIDRNMLITGKIVCWITIPLIFAFLQSFSVSRPNVGKSTRKSCFDLGIFIKSLFFRLFFLIDFNISFVPFLFSIEIIL